MKIIGLKEVQKLLGCSEAQAKFILNQKDCPTFKREKYGHYKIFDEALDEYLKWKKWK